MKLLHLYVKQLLTKSMSFTSYLYILFKRYLLFIIAKLFLKVFFTIRTLVGGIVNFIGYFNFFYLKGKIILFLHVCVFLPQRFGNIRARFSSSSVFWLSHYQCPMVSGPPTISAVDNTEKLHQKHQNLLYARSVLICNNLFLHA